MTQLIVGLGDCDTDDTAIDELGDCNIDDATIDELGEKIDHLQFIIDDDGLWLEGWISRRGLLATCFDSARGVARCGSEWGCNNQDPVATGAPWALPSTEPLPPSFVFVDPA